MAPPFSGSLLRWISHQRAMSCRTRLRVDCDLGTLPVNVRTSRAPSLSMIRQCRKAKSKGSSFLSEKFTLNIGLGWVCVILPPHCVRALGSVYHSQWRSIRFADAVFAQADTAQPFYLSCVSSARARLSEKRILTNRTLRFVIIPVSYLGDFLSFLCVEGHSVLRQLVSLPCLGGHESHICRDRGGAPSCAAGSPLYWRPFATAGRRPV